MHIEQVHFDEVFDIQAGRGDFSFRSGGTPTYGVNLRNRFIPAAGSRYAIAFERRGDWDSVVAWRALGAREVDFKTPGWLALTLCFADFLWFVPSTIAAGLVFGGPALALALAAAFLALAAVGAGWGIRRNRAVERALLAFDETPSGRDRSGTVRASPAL